MLQEAPLGILWAGFIPLAPPYFLETGYELAWSLGARDCKIPPFLSSSESLHFPGAQSPPRRGEIHPSISPDEG